MIELDALAEIVTFAYAAAMIALLLWMRKQEKSPRWRRILLGGSLLLPLLWLFDHL